MGLFKADCDIFYSKYFTFWKLIQDYLFYQNDIA